MGKVKFKMRPDEALRILNIEKPELTKELLNQVSEAERKRPDLSFTLFRDFPSPLQRYKVMFANNDPAKGGSFYLQSKIFRSKEVLEKEVLGITDEPAGSEEAKPEGAADSATEGNKEKEESNTKRSA